MHLVAAAFDLQPLLLLGATLVQTMCSEITHAKNM